MNVINTKGVEIYGGSPAVKGSLRLNSPLQMAASNERHMQPGVENADSSSSSFMSMLNNAISGVERLDNRAHKLTVQSVVEPDSVEAHEVVLAAEKAKFALNLTKNVTDGLIRTFRELTNPR